MKTASLFLAVLLLAALLAVPAMTLHAQDDRSYEGHWWCSSLDQEGPAYITGVWTGNYFVGEVMNAFAQELLAKHAYKGMVNCARANLPTSTFAQVQAGARAQITAWRDAGRKVVEVPWAYDTAKATLPHLCTAYVTVQKDGTRTDYFYHNKILRIPGGTQAKLTMAWDAHMKERHPGSYFPVPAGCVLLPANPEMHQQQVDAFVQMYAGQKPEIVQLDWVYEAATPAEEAVAQAADDTPAFYCEMVGQGAREWYGTPVQVADKDWKWEDYTGAWRRYAQTTLKLDPNLFIGACEPGTMKTQTRARAVRKEGFSGQGWTKLHDVDWKYVP